MKFTLIKKQNEVGNAKTFIFKPDTQISWKAGQYFIYYLEHENKDLRGKMRFFTISSAPFEKYPSITTRIVKTSSTFKKALNKLKIGENLEVKGPDGDFIIENKNKSFVFIAGGIGITPFHSILKQMEYEKKDLDILLLYSNADKDIVFKNELKKLNLKNLKIKFLIKKQIKEKNIIEIKDFKDKFFYVSGPEPMVESLEQLLDKLKVSKRNQYYDYFSGYKNI